MRRMIVATLLLATSLGHAATIVVPPGPGTPVQDAIDAANPGDTIRLTLGAYPEHLVIDKPIRLRGVRSASELPNDTTMVGGGCGVQPTIMIFGDGVQVRSIQILADNQGGIEAWGTDRLKLTDIFVGSACMNHSAPLVNVELSRRAKLTKVWAAGQPVRTVPAGIRIADIGTEQRVRVTRCIAGGNDVGVLLENNDVRGVRVSGSHVNFNLRGIVLQGTRGALVDRVTLIDDTTSGIEVDAASSDNLILRNRISGSATDVADAGTGNCWRNNTFATGSVPACP